MILYVENPTRLIKKLKYSGRRQHCQAVPSFQNRSQCSSNRFQQGFVSNNADAHSSRGELTSLPRETRNSPSVHT